MGTSSEVTEQKGENAVQPRVYKVELRGKQYAVPCVTVSAMWDSGGVGPDAFVHENMVKGLSDSGDISLVSLSPPVAVQWWTDVCHKSVPLVVSPDVVRHQLGIELG